MTHGAGPHIPRLQPGNGRSFLPGRWLRAVAFAGVGWGAASGCSALLRSSDASFNQTGDASVDAHASTADARIRTGDASPAGSAACLGESGGKRLSADTPRVGALFGTAIAADGDVLVATAPFEPLDAVENQINRTTDCNTNLKQLYSRGKGRVRVFERTTRGWIQQSLDISGSSEVEAQVPPMSFSGYPDEGIYPTYSVAVSSGTIAVGVGGDGRRAEYRGSVRLFRKGTAGWTEAAPPIEQPTSRERDLFGMSVAISGSTLVVGAPSEDRTFDGGIFDGGAGDGASGVFDGGAVYVYDLEDTRASRSTRLVPNVQLPSSYFGSGLAVNADWIAVGAPGEDPQNVHFFYGNVYMFRRNAAGIELAGPLEVPDRAMLGTFGSTLALHGDTLVVGAPTSAGCSHRPVPMMLGAAHIFRLVGDKWIWQQCLDGASAPNGAFAYSVALGAHTLLVGASLDTFAENLTSAGTVYEYRRSGALFDPEPCVVRAPEPTQCGAFGLSFALTNSYVAIGSPYEGSDASSWSSPLDSGGIYVYPLSEPP